MALSFLKVTGIDQVSKNLGKQLRKIEGVTAIGLGAAALHIQGQSQRNSPRLTGNLKGSHFTLLKEDNYGNSMNKTGSTVKIRKDMDPIPDKVKNKPREEAARKAASFAAEKLATKSKGATAIVGVGASYGVFVHEMPMVNEWKEGGNKFLEEAFKSEAGRVIQIVKSYASV